ncbi:hypothetical protein V6R21_13440 [Limibacter armeniacum]|uniref:DUF3244 domain-containing protein n=1 Tax=Limibacter armeniacum TaxID=466084 RepID=UPI002FE5AFE3
MKKLVSNSVLVFVMVFLVSISGAFAFNGGEGDGDKKKSNDSKLSSYDAAIYKHRGDKIAVHFVKPENNKVLVLIKNENDRVIFRDTFRNKNRVVKHYDLSHLPSGKYSIEVLNKDAVVKSRGGDVVEDKSNISSEFELR